ncbi:MAG: cell division protein ZapD [Pseudomonadota bacterium]
MVRVATETTGDQPALAVNTYEQPLNERMRTFLRLEFLYRTTEFHVADSSEASTRQAVDGLLEICAILSRGDVRSELLKELDRQLDQLHRFRDNPGVDASRVEACMRELAGIREATNTIGPHYLQKLRDSEFLSAIKHRSAIPGGTCEFDLPVFSHWLRRPYEARREDLDEWLKDLRPLCGGIKYIMWLIRQSAVPQHCRANNGMFQNSLGKDCDCRMLRVTLTERSELFPEISGSPHRFTIRFLTWSGVGGRALQTNEDVDFQLSIC